jgi:hypothetical protein
MVLRLARAELAEVLGCLGDYIGEEFELNAAERFSCEMEKSGVSCGRSFLMISRDIEGEKEGRKKEAKKEKQKEKDRNQKGNLEAQEKRRTSKGDVEKDPVDSCQWESASVRVTRLTAGCPRRGVGWEACCGEEKREEMFRRE